MNPTFYFNSPKMFRRPSIFSSFDHLITAESTRHGGVSTPPFASLNLGLSTTDSPAHVAQNQALFWQSLGISPDQIASSHQVHGAEILEITHPGRHEGYDALITNQKDILLTVTVADCTPILIYDHQRRAIAAIHAGWRGTVQEIVSKTVRKMQDTYRTDPAQCYAYVGTCIDECSFEVGEEVADQFDTPYKRFDQAVGKYFVDLKKANRNQLIQAGIPETNIQTSEYSTVIHNQDYFSFRHENGVTGRLLVCIGLKH